MHDSTEPSDLSPQSSKKREHSANGRKKLVKETSKQKQQPYAQEDQKVIKLKKNAEIDSTTAAPLPEGLAEQDSAHPVTEEHLTPFSSLLRKIIRRDRAEIARIAH